MGEVREGSVSESVKKKHKKRKSDESRVLGVEDSAVVGLLEGGSRKKAKTDVLGDIELNLDMRVDTGESGLMVEDINYSDKKKKKMKAKKSGSEDVGGESKGIRVSREGESGLMVEDMNNGDKKKMKKKEKKSGSEDVVGDSKGIETSNEGENGLIVEDMNNTDKKKKKKKEKKSGSEEVVGDSKGIETSKEGENGLMVEDMNNSDKKKKKKEKKSGSEDVVGDSKGIETSGGMNGEECVGKWLGDLNMETGKTVGVNDAKMGDGKTMNDVETNGEMNSEVGVVNEEGKVKKDKKEKRKKSKSESRSMGADDTGLEEVVGLMSSSEKKIVSGSSEEVEHVKKKKKKRTKDVCEVTEIEEYAKGKKPKKHKSDVGVNTENSANAAASVRIEGNELTESVEKSNLKKTPKKVKFADNIEVFSLPDNFSEGEENVVDGGKPSKVKKGLVDGGKEELVSGSKLSRKMQKLMDSDKETNLVQGKRFSKEEDEMLRNAVLKYVEDHRLGEEGVKMVLQCRKHRDKVKDCWKVITEALPWRHKAAIYSRAHILFERSENRRWTKEELEEVRKYHEKYGPKWRELADELGRNRIHVKDAFRQVRLPDKKIGQWSQEEYQTLFDLVNKDLRMRASMDRKSKHGMLRDNIGWEAISEKLSTRTDPVCCQKWYAQLTSSLVVDGLWADTDDYRLLMALDELDATCEEEVEWDRLLEHRTGEVCRKRWNEMVRHIGEHAKKSFSEQVETLSERYCPDVLDARETYDSKPFVDV